MYANQLTNNRLVVFTFLSLKVPYDYDSLMHYGKTTFSKNGSPTIRAIHDPDKRLGRRDGFSPLDVHEINSLYDCASE